MKKLVTLITAISLALGLNNANISKNVIHPLYAVAQDKPFAEAYGLLNTSKLDCSKIVGRSEIASVSKVYNSSSKRVEFHLNSENLKTGYFTKEGLGFLEFDMINGFELSAEATGNISAVNGTVVSKLDATANNHVVFASSITNRNRSIFEAEGQSGSAFYGDWAEKNDYGFLPLLSTFYIVYDTELTSLDFYVYENYEGDYKTIQQSSIKYAVAYDQAYDGITKFDQTQTLTLNKYYSQDYILANFLDTVTLFGTRNLEKYYVVDSDFVDNLDGNFTIHVTGMDFDELMSNATVKIEVNTVGTENPGTASSENTSIVLPNPGSQTSAVSSVSSEVSSDDTHSTSASHPSSDADGSSSQAADSGNWFLDFFNAIGQFFQDMFNSISNWFNGIFNGASDYVKGSSSSSGGSN
jgi:hypothetical protein